MSDQNHVNTPRPEWSYMVELWHPIETLLGGTRAMREAGRTYLPQEKGEDNDAYKARLARTVLFNGFKRAVMNLVGKPYQRQITLGEDMPSDVAAWTEDIDLEGNNITVFAAEQLKTSLAYGLSHILVDFPRNTASNLSEERNLGLRPFLRLIHPNRVIGWRSERRMGRDRLVQLRILEHAVVPDGDFGVRIAPRVLVYQAEGETISWRLYESRPEDVSTMNGSQRPNHLGLTEGGDTFTVIDEGTLANFNEIPFVTHYAAKTGFMTAEPPLADLADLNIAHWQSSSDQTHILHVARVPILFGSGFDSSENELVVGPNSFIKSTDPQADMKYVEHNGNAIKSGRDHIMDIEDQMVALGLEMLLRKPGDQTATETAIDAAAAGSQLGLITQTQQDSLETAFKIMAKWAGKGEDAGGSLSIFREWITLGDKTDIERLLNARRQRDISRETFWTELQRRGFLGDDFDPDLEAEMLDNERQESLALMGGTFDTSNDDDDEEDDNVDDN